jgi:hypothetical protein
MAIYSTLYGLPQSMVDYLNQPLPDISGIFQPSGPSIPTPVSVEDVITEEGIASLYPQVATSDGGGGDSFSPFDIRPGDSSIRTFDQYNPYAYNQAMRNTEKFGQTVGPNPNLYYAPPTGIEQLLSKIPTPFGLIKKGLDALGDKLPVNRGAIFQNELLGQGIKLDSLGRIVTDNYNTPQGIMAGYNTISGGGLNMLTGGAYGEPTQYGLANAVAERRENIRNTLQDKYGLSDQQIDQVLDEIEETGTYKGKLGFNQTMDKTTNLFKNLYDLGRYDLLEKNALKKYQPIVEQEQIRKRKSNPAFIEQQKIEKYAKDKRDFQQTVAARASAVAQEKANRDAARQAGIEAARASAVAQEKANRDAARQAGIEAARASAVAQEKANRDAARQAGIEAARASAVAQEKANRDAARKGEGGGGDFAGKGSGASGPAGRFSDKRLKENIELIGKSPSNINIYKFNYKNNPTTYQGVMADEVSWASVKHPNGYMMVDYNKIDVEFKKI